MTLEGTDILLPKSENIEIQKTYLQIKYRFYLNFDYNKDSSFSPPLPFYDIYVSICNMNKRVCVCVHTFFSCVCRGQRRLFVGCPARSVSALISWDRLPHRTCSLAFGQAAWPVSPSNSLTPNSYSAWFMGTQVLTWILGMGTHVLMPAHLALLKCLTSKNIFITF